MYLHSIPVIASPSLLIEVDNNRQLFVLDFFLRNFLEQCNQFMTHFE